MLKEYAAIFRRLMIFADLCIIALVFYLGYRYRAAPQHYPVSGYLSVLPVLLGVWGYLLYSFGMYRSFRLRKINEVFAIVLKSGFVGFIVFVSLVYIFKLDHISRSMITFVFGYVCVMISLEKVVLIMVFRQIRKKGFNYRRVIVVGTGRRAQQFIDSVNKHPVYGMKIVGVVDEDETKVGESVHGQKVLGAFADLPRIIRTMIVDDMVFIIPRSWLNKIENILFLCETQGLKIHVAVDYFELKFSRAKLGELHGFPFLTFESTPDKIWHLIFKRLIDVLLSGIALLVLSPVFIIVAVLIKSDSPGPVFFRQVRCSLNGRKFTLYKFRTMFKDAELKLKELLALNEMAGPVFKMSNDPRITGAGKFLRKYSIDELPQLWNVFRGDMSLVGPRPPLPSEVEAYDTWQRRRLSMRPGITCLWQISGRNQIIDFNRWVKLDLEYIDNWSLWLDLDILLKTVPVVFCGIGAK
jgi:exopolysaccharide biosynthesis polyprenyl glycosylphosphotransferase